MFATDKIGDTMTVAMTPGRRQGMVRRGAAGPVGRVARSRRATGCTTISSASTATTSRPPAGTTWCSRTSACRTCCGSCRASTGSSRPSTRTTRRRSAAAIAVKGLVSVEPLPGDKYVVSRRSRRDDAGHDDAGRVQDDGRRPRQLPGLHGEPAKNKRISLGIIVLLFLGVLFIFAYWLKREYWKDVH